MITYKPKVLAAMSGGVDSSVAATLLKQQGYFVVGGYMKNFSQESWEGVIEDNCPWEEDVKVLKAVCNQIGIELKVFNFEKEYKEKVIEYFFREYAAGRTPNPDVVCNSEIKFGIFLGKARELGFDYIATGHYARLRREAPNPKSQIPKCDLLKGVDPKKDQSYFLYRLNQEQLSRALFPIGEYTKPQVRELAREFELPNADRKDSQGLCFIGHINLREFLKQRIPERGGEIVTSSGEVIGAHRGAAYYTIGQRHGLGIGGGTPYYVAKKNILNNTLTITPESGRLLYQTKLNINDVGWINSAHKFPMKCTSKIRYRQQDQKCTVFLSPGEERVPRAQARGRGVEVQFDKPQFAPAPGQSVVFYQEDKVLGGGIIA